MKEQENEIGLLLGGNLGDVIQTFIEVRSALREKYRIYRTSSLYKTEAWGMENAPPFINQVLVLKTTDQAQEVFKYSRHLEEQFGRKRIGNEASYTSRHLDIDVLTCNEEVVEREDLIIPHPRLHLRNFTLAPMYEVIPHWKHPLLKQTVEQLWQKTSDNHRVEKL